MASDPRRAPGCLDLEAAGARVGGLFEQHGRLVYGICRLLLRDQHDAEDATQQTFLSAYRSLLNGHEPREPAAWLGTIARNECRARIRDRMARPLSVVRASAGEASTENEVGRREEVAVLTEALAGLPQRQREAIVLREFYGLSHEEVALALGVSVSAVDALLVRARKRLQKELKPARAASGMLALPLVLSESLGQSIPGFLSGAGSSGLVSKLSSLPLLAKLAGAAATVAVVGVAGSVAVHDRPPLPTGPRSARAATAPSVHARVDATPASERIRTAARAATVAGEVEEDESERGGRQARGDDENAAGEIAAKDEGDGGEAEVEDAAEVAATEGPSGDGGESGQAGDGGESGSSESSGDD